MFSIYGLLISLELFYIYMAMGKKIKYFIVLKWPVDESAIKHSALSIAMQKI